MLALSCVSEFLQVHRAHLPFNGSIFSFPNSVVLPSASILLCSGQSRRTVSRVNLGLDVKSLPNQDRSVGVVLLHGRVGAQEEIPEWSNQRRVFSNRGHRRGARAYRAAALWDEDWQRAKRSSLTALLKAYLEAMVGVGGGMERRGWLLQLCCRVHCDGVDVGAQAGLGARVRDSGLHSSLHASTPPGLSKLRAFSSYPRPLFSPHLALLPFFSAITLYPFD